MNSSPPAPDRRRWLILFAGLIALTAGCTFQYGIAYLIPALRQDGYSLELAGVLVACPTVGLLLTLIGWGAAADRYGERVVLGAWDRDILAATVTLLLDCPPNQPHRAEIAKLMTRPSHRGRGLAAALMRAAEDEAVRRHRSLLVLDTATDGGAAGLYEGLGYTRAGEIPDYALKPHGGLTGTLLYWKRIGRSWPCPP